MRIQFPRTKARRRREAARWLARIKAEDSECSEELFRRWHNADAANAEAFARVSRTYEKTGLLRNSPVVREHSLDSHITQSGRQRGFAFATAIAALVLIPVGATALHQLGIPPFQNRETFLLATRIGEIRRVALDDGTEVTLDTQSRVRIDPFRRHAVLEQGRARFAIAEHGASFTVTAGGRQIKSTAGVFDVDLTNAARFFRLLSGKAEIRGGWPSNGASSRFALRGGQPADGHSLPGSGAQQAADWTDGVLQFDATPLAEVVADANRYSRSRIIVNGRETGSITVTGAFRAGDNARLARALGETLGLDLERTAAGDFLLSRDQAKKKVG